MQNDNQLSHEDLLQIVELVQSSPQFSEFRLKLGEIEIDLRREAEAPPSPAAAEPGFEAGALVVRSPAVGSFHRAAEPGGRPCVEVGQTVEAGAALGAVKVLRRMVPIPAGAGGVITRLLVDDAAAVEYGQPLAVLQPQ